MAGELPLERHPTFEAVLDAHDEAILASKGKTALRKRLDSFLLSLLTTAQSAPPLNHRTAGLVRW